MFGISLRLKREVQKLLYSYFTVVFSSFRWSYKPSFKKFLGANFEINDFKVNFVQFLPMFGISLRLKREVQKFLYSYFTVVFSSFRWSYKPSFKKFLWANFEINDLKVNFVPFLPIFGISLRLKREVQKFVYSYFTLVFSSVRWSPATIHPATIYPATIYPATIHPATIHSVTIHPVLMIYIYVCLSMHISEYSTTIYPVSMMRTQAQRITRSWNLVNPLRHKPSYRCPMLTAYFEKILVLLLENDACLFSSFSSYFYSNK